MAKKIGVYIHIPFCARKCAYCDFYSVAEKDGRMTQYQNAIERQIKESAPLLRDYHIDSIYFGGGTPSYFGAQRIVGLFNALKDHCRVLLDSEVTMEANPDSITRADLKLLRRSGINRISLGAQTADDALGKSLGRLHTFSQVESAVANAYDVGFSNVSLDLIYGLPGQTRGDWIETLNRAIALRPAHISCYGLRIEPATPLYLYKDDPTIPDEDTQADMYLYAVDSLRGNGFRQYEISNFAAQGAHSRHNLKYWQREEYIGFGPTAHSYIGGVRYSYIKGLEPYLAALKSGNSILDSHETIPSSEQAIEYLMLGLRTTYGITGDEYYSIYQSNFAPLEKLLTSYEQNGWAHRVNNRWSFTPTGFLLSNRLIRNLLDAHSETRQSAMPWRKPSQMNNAG